MVSHEGASSAQVAARAARLRPIDALRFSLMGGTTRLNHLSGSATTFRHQDHTQTNNFGRVIPYGGRLDPATGAWSRLPHAPGEQTGGWPVEAPGGPLVAAEGWLYDDAEGAWTRLPRPEDSPATPGPAVWAGGVLVVHGGADWDLPDRPDEWTPEGRPRPRPIESLSCRCLWRSRRCVAPRS